MCRFPGDSMEGRYYSRHPRVIPRDGLDPRSRCHVHFFARAHTAGNVAQRDLFVSIRAHAGYSRTMTGIEAYCLSNTGDRVTMRVARMENRPSLMIGQVLANRCVPRTDSDMIWSVAATL